MRRFGWIVVIGILFLMSYSTAFCVTTAFWKQKTSADFEKGITENIAITSNGEMVLSPELKLVSETLSELYIWALAADSKGNIYAGTGNGGKIYKITPTGETSVFMDSPQVSILSLAFDQKDNLYAGTSPDGLIYKITPAGTATTFYQTEQQYVWSLTFDNQGILYAGTGTHGQIFQIKPDGTGELWYDTRETHVMCLLMNDQILYAGGAGNGLIYKITADQVAYVLYDSPEEEIHCLAMDNKQNLYAGSIPVNYLDTPPPEVDRQNRNGENPERGAGESSMPQPFQVSMSHQQSSVYQITPDGRVDRIWHSPEPLILSMLINSDGDLLIGTGNSGSLYRVSLDDHLQYTRLLKSRDSQLLAILQSKKSGKIYVASGNLGRLYELTDTVLTTGTFESSAYDSKFYSNWGVISWEGRIPTGTKITFATRSGNTEDPDDTWSSWSNEYENPNMEAKITSPAARFIQWRATLSTTDAIISPTLHNVSVAFLSENIAPKISSISVYTAGESVGSADKNEGTTPPPSSDQQMEKNNGLEKGLCTAKWECIDKNNDKLNYHLYFRGKNEDQWKLLVENLLHPEYTWNTQTFPDGEYQLKVIASDSLSNPRDLAKTAEYESLYFIIDNTPLEITNLQTTPQSNGQVGVTADAADNINRLREAAYAVDGGQWQVIFPEDMIFDQKKEHFSFVLSSLSKGEHLLVLKVVDNAGNIGTKKVVFIIK